ncbi:MAG: hypothetical protein ACI88H_003634 [Cocleimonas sp.]|jgi:hypothetical protein
MASIKYNLYRDLNVTTREFILLAIGYFDFNNFHIFKREDLNYVFDLAYLTYVDADINLLKKQLQEEKEGKTNSQTKEDYKFKRYKETQESVSLLTSGFLERCNGFQKSDLLAVHKLHRLLNNLKKYHKDHFPASIEGKASHINSWEDTYNKYELIICLYENTHVTDIKFSPYFEAIFKNLDKNNDAINTESDNQDGYVKIDTLPLDMQFIIECHSEPSYQHSHVYNKEKQLTNFKDDTVLKMIELSKKRKLTHIHQRKELSGLPKTKVENIFDFIQNK